MRSEPRQWFERRNALQSQQYPELNWATPKMVSQVDALRVNRGQLPSQLTLDTTSLARQLTPPPRPPDDGLVPSRVSPKAVRVPPTSQGGNWLSGAVSGAGSFLSDAASSAGSVFTRALELGGESQYQSDVAAPMAQAEAIRNSGMYLNKDAWAEYGTGIGDFVRSSFAGTSLSDEDIARLEGTRYEVRPAHRGSISPSALAETLGVAATPPIIAGNPIIETATNPSTYMFGSGMGAKIVTGSALALGAESGVEALGGSEGQQSAAGMVGHIAPFSRDFVGLAKLGSRGVGAVGRGLSNTRLNAIGDAAALAAVEGPAARATRLAAERGAKTLAEAEQAALAPVRQPRLYNIPSPSEFLAGIRGAPTVQKIARVERAAERSALGLTEIENAKAAPFFRALGRQIRRGGKNVELADIKPSAFEESLGLKNALLVRVLEKPGEYALTAKQLEAVKEIARIPEALKIERGLHGVAPELVQVPDGHNFIWRVVKKGKEGTGQRKGRPGTTPSSGIGFKKDNHREYLDIDDALKDQVVYVNPEIAFNERIKESFSIIRDARMRELYATVAGRTTSAQRVSAVTKSQSREIVGELDALAAKYPGTALAPEARIAEIVKSNRRVGVDDLDGLIAELKKATTGRISSHRGWRRTPEALVKAREEDIASLVASLTAKKDSFRRAINRAEALPKGMQEIAPDVAPGLKDLEFTKRAANKIEDHYLAQMRLRVPGTDIGYKVRAEFPLVQGASKLLIPIRAAGDFSAVLINNGIVASRNPLTFIKNVAKATKDMAREPGYQRWLTSQEVAMAADKGVAITGRAGEAAEFQLANWMVHIPLPGGRRMATPILKGLNDHYNILNNRQRVSLFNQRVRMMERGGESVSRETQEGIARSYNRLTGIPDARATNVEQMAAFAPNFMRAHLETLAHAVQFGTVESRIAKEYLATAGVVGTSAVTALALNQGRPLDEVLQPFDRNALRRGEIKMNPNFMTMRLFGQDIKIYGKFDSIMRLAAITSDAGLQAIIDESPKEMWAALTYYLGSQGSPLVSWFTAVSQGETFSGNEPISWPGIAEQFTPFTVPEVARGVYEGGQAIREGFTGEGDFSAAIDPLAAAAVTTLGGKASPMTTTERVMAGERDEFTPEEERASINAASWKSVLDSDAGGTDAFRKSHQPRQSGRDKVWFEDPAIVSPQGFTNFWEWRQAQEAAFRAALEEDYALLPALLTAEVKKRIDATFIMDAYLDHKADKTTRWVNENTAKAWELWQTDAQYGDDDYWNPSEGDKEIMLNWWWASQSAQPAVVR